MMQHSPWNRLKMSAGKLSFTDLFCPEDDIKENFMTENFVYLKWQSEGQI